MMQAYRRWLGASMSVTGITGAFDTLAAEDWGMVGSGDLTFDSCWFESLLTEDFRSASGVEGKDDRSRGV